MDDDEDDDDEYEVVGYGGRASTVTTPSRGPWNGATGGRASASAGASAGASAKKAPVGFDWNGNDGNDARGVRDGRVDDDDDDANGEEEENVIFDLGRTLDAVTREKHTGEGVVEDEDDIRATPSPKTDGGRRRTSTAGGTVVSPRRSPRLARRRSMDARDGGDTPGAKRQRTREEIEADEERARRDAAVLAEALGVSAEAAVEAGKAMQKRRIEATTTSGAAKTKTKTTTTTATARGGKGASAKNGRGATSPKKKMERKKPAATSGARGGLGGGGVLGRLNLLTQSSARPTVPESRASEKTNANADVETRVAPSETVDVNANVEDDIVMDDIDDVEDVIPSDDDDAGAQPSAADGPVPSTTGLGALSRLPKMSSPTFLPRASVGATLASQRNKPRNAGLLTSRLQRVLQNARTSHAQFLKKVSSSQLPSTRGALLFTVNAARLDASMTNCAGCVCDLESATTADETDDGNVEYTRAIVVFNSTQAQELSLEAGRRLAIYPPWREVDLPGRDGDSPSAIDEDVPRVLLCCENVLRLD